MPSPNTKAALSPCFPHAAILDNMLHDLPLPKANMVCQKVHVLQLLEQHMLPM
jgi:hypothetical protein